MGYRLKRSFWQLEKVERSSLASMAIGGGGHLNSLGGYFFAPPPKVLELCGGTEGMAWDDGIYDGVKGVCAGRDRSGRLNYLKFVYAKGNNSVKHKHGIKLGQLTEFKLDYPDEHIAVVKGTYDSGLVTSLTFVTSKGKSSPAIGKRVGPEFVLGENGLKLVGFRGRSGDFINAVGAHFVPVPVQAKKLKAKVG